MSQPGMGRIGDAALLVGDQLDLGALMRGENRQEIGLH
jgi:hypothetical protein